MTQKNYDYLFPPLLCVSLFSFLLLLFAYQRQEETLNVLRKRVEILEQYMADSDTLAVDDAILCEHD